MGRTAEPLVLAVEQPADGVIVVRVAGELNRMTAPRLARLLDGQLDRCLAAARRTDTRAHLIVDLGNVGHFGEGGLLILRHAQYTATEADVGLHLTGLTARAGQLPGWAGDLLARFDGFPTLEDAVRTLRAEEQEARR